MGNDLMLLTYLCVNPDILMPESDVVLTTTDINDKSNRIAYQKYASLDTIIHTIGM